MNVIVKRVGEAPKHENVNDTLEAFQSIIGGFLQVLPVTNDGLAMYCNEEGKLKRLPPNFKLPHDVIVGDVIFFRTDGEYETDVLEGDLKIVEAFTKENFELKC